MIEQKAGRKDLGNLKLCNSTNFLNMGSSAMVMWCEVLLFVISCILGELVKMPIPRAPLWKFWILKTDGAQGWAHFFRPTPQVIPKFVRQWWAHCSGWRPDISSWVGFLSTFQVCVCPLSTLPALMSPLHNPESEGWGRHFLQKWLPGSCWQTCLQEKF